MARREHRGGGTTVRESLSELWGRGEGSPGMLHCEGIDRRLTESPATEEGRGSGAEVGEKGK